MLYPARAASAALVVGRASTTGLPEDCTVLQRQYDRDLLEPVAVPSAKLVQEVGDLGEKAGAQRADQKLRCSSERAEAPRRRLVLSRIRAAGGLACALGGMRQNPDMRLTSRRETDGGRRAGAIIASCGHHNIVTCSIRQGSSGRLRLASALAGRCGCARPAWPELLGGRRSRCRRSGRDWLLVAGG